MQMAGVPQDEYPAIAHHIRPFLEAFAKDGAHTVAFFEAQILDRSMQCWIAGDGRIKAVCLTEIGTDDLKTCHVSYATGEDHKEWGGLMEQLCLWAKSIGCVRVRATCRPGYQRLLTQHSFKTSHVVMDRVL